ncbi:hypothetical protein AMTRI_Chr03g138270 [Amborella trichopoda]
MIKNCLQTHTHREKYSHCLKSFIKTYSSHVTVPETANPVKKVCQILMASPKVGLEHTLDESGVRVSPDLVEDILKRFENAGMQAYRFFQWVDKQINYSHSVKSYHIMIGSLAKIRQYQLMWDLVNDMRRKDILNNETFCIMIRKYARAHKVDEAVYTFNVMDKFGLTPNLTAFNSLLSAFCKAKNVRKAQEIFDDMKDRFEPNSITYSILLEGWGKEPNLPKAREIFLEMIDKNCEPDIVTYGIMIDSLCKAGRVEEATGYMKEMRSRGCIPTSYIYSILIHTYGVERSIGDAVDSFLEMEKDGIKADVAAYNALISAFCRAKKFKNVYRVLEEMDKKSVAPNSRTCNIILNGLIGSGETDEAFRIFKRMIKHCEPDSDTYTMMIKMFCEIDKLEKAMKVWKYMGLKQFVPSMHTFSVLINGLCRKGELNKACILLEDMIEKGIRPPDLTFRRVRQLLLKEGRKDVLEFLVEKMNVLIKEPLND